MPFFDPMRDYFHRRQAQMLNVLAERVHLVNQRTESLRDNFVFPGTDYFDNIEVDGQHVGYVDYGINPLGDRLYINELQILPEHQRRGVGRGVLWRLWLTHQVPIVPLHQYGTSNGFWSLARREFAAAGALIQDQLHSQEALDQAKQRWIHLVPESAKDRSIREYWKWVESEKAAGRRAGPGIR
ncbi:GNAT family N-acetyltransferase [Pseudomonas sp. MF5691]|uniref:GNAT family N-acetyltransferase n=1 Tax=Pseudomonas sp. MF5691 TaxID=2797526 RepID=UPI0018E831BD|nr:GNAT family N-acetyltransferase [Pseudomonas sp. MF5691]MBJ2292927.1 GNAT family N-acetyltransferase [Pseudomonas sp. MF5691]